MKKLIFTVLVMAVLTATADADPISHWKLDETIGNTTSDSADGNPGTVYGAQWTTGRVGGALSFDGVNDYVDVGDKDNLDFGATASFSIAAWVNSNIDTYVDTAIVDKKRIDAGGYSREGYTFKIYMDTLYFGIEDTSSNVVVTAGNTPIRDNKWHHVAAVRDTAQDKLYIYLDGVLDAAPVVDTTIGTLATSRSFRIGYAQYYPIFFDGMIDDVRVYNHALSQNEIVAIMPEPATLLLLGLGAIMLKTSRR
ncbi:MAG: LamG domain-containing protein [Sedimentisphaerales bacterium]